MSEGLDFANNLCRGVVCISIPFLNPRDTVVKSRREFQNNIKRDLGKIVYEGEAFVALNQALGRAIRGINDFGCLFVVDSRMRG